MLIRPSSITVLSIITISHSECSTTRLNLDHDAAVGDYIAVPSWACACAAFGPIGLCNPCRVKASHRP